MRRSRDRRGVVFKRPSPPPPPHQVVEIQRPIMAPRGLRWGLEISWIFLYIHWECCTKFLSFYFAQRRLQDHFLGGMFDKFRPFFFLKNFGNCKSLIMCDGLVYWETCHEIWPKSFKKQRCYDISKHLLKKRRLLFLAPWTQNLRIFGIFENRSCSSWWEKSNGIYPIEIGLTVLEISGGPNRPPPPTHTHTPVNVLQKAHQ